MNKQLTSYVYLVLAVHLAILATGWRHILNSEDKIVRTISFGDPSVTLKLGSHTIMGVDKIRQMGQEAQQKKAEKKKVVKDKFALPDDKNLAKKEVKPTEVQEGRPGQLTQMGGGEGVGAGGMAGTGSLSGNARADLRTLFHTELRARIEANKAYPAMSRRLGHTGMVVVAFTLLEDGNIINLRIEKPSPYDRLNESALEAVKKVQKFRPIPKELGEAKMDIKVPVKFVTI